MSLVIAVDEDRHEVQITGEMKDPPFKNPVLKYYLWLFHFSDTFRFSGFRITDLTGSLCINVLRGRRTVVTLGLARFG